MSSAKFGGYQWYGLYNTEHGAVGAFYDERQLRLTFSHETFHVINNNNRGDRSFAYLVINHYDRLNGNGSTRNAVCPVVSEIDSTRP